MAQQILLLWVGQYGNVRPASPCSVLSWMKVRQVQTIYTSIYKDWLVRNMSQWHGRLLLVCTSPVSHSSRWGQEVWRRSCGASWLYWSPSWSWLPVQMSQLAWQNTPLPLLESSLYLVAAVLLSPSWVSELEYLNLLYSSLNTPSQTKLLQVPTLLLYFTPLTLELHKNRGMDIH